MSERVKSTGVTPRVYGVTTSRRQFLKGATLTGLALAVGCADFEPGSEVVPIDQPVTKQPDRAVPATGIPTVESEYSPFEQSVLSLFEKELNSIQSIYAPESEEYADVVSHVLVLGKTLWGYGSDNQEVEVIGKGVNLVDPMNVHLSVFPSLAGAEYPLMRDITVAVVVNDDITTGNDLGGTSIIFTGELPDEHVSQQLLLDQTLYLRTTQAGHNIVKYQNVGTVHGATIDTFVEVFGEGDDVTMVRYLTPEVKWETPLDPSLIVVPDEVSSQMIESFRFYDVSEPNGHGDDMIGRYWVGNESPLAPPPSEAIDLKYSVDENTPVLVTPEGDIKFRYSYEEGTWNEELSYKAQLIEQFELNDETTKEELESRKPHILEIARENLMFVEIAPELHERLNSYYGEMDLVPSEVIFEENHILYSDSKTGIVLAAAQIEDGEVVSVLPATYVSNGARVLLLNDETVLDGSSGKWMGLSNENIITAQANTEAAIQVALAICHADEKLPEPYTDKNVNRLTDTERDDITTRMVQKYSQDLDSAIANGGSFEIPVFDGGRLRFDATNDTLIFRIQQGFSTTQSGHEGRFTTNINIQEPYWRYSLDAPIGGTFSATIRQYLVGGDLFTNGRYDMWRDPTTYQDSDLTHGIVLASGGYATLAEFKEEFPELNANSGLPKYNLSGVTTDTFLLVGN